jgi:hypothetical protein
MLSYLNDLIAQQDKASVASKVKPRNAKSLRKAISELAAEQNGRVPAERRVTQRDIETVASRSLNKTAGLDRQSRFFAAYKEVASFLTLAVDGNVPVGVTNHRDLLPIGHPLSTRGHSMTASAYSNVVARWIAADPRIDDSVRGIVASVYGSQAGSVEHQHALARLSMVAAGLVPQDILISTTEKLETVVAIIAAGGNDSASRSARARAQRRDRKGRFAEQGGGMQFFLKGLDGKISSIVGKFVANSDKTDGFQIEVRNDPTLKDGLYDVPASQVEAIKAILPDSALPDDSAEVTLPSDVDAVELSSLQPIDVPAGWTLVSEKKDGEDGPDKVFKTDDGYRVDWYAPGTDMQVLNDAFVKANNQNKANSPIAGPKVLDGNIATKDLAGGYRLKKHAWDKENAPWMFLRRDDEDGIVKEQTVGLSQSWADTIDFIENDQDYYDEVKTKSAEKKQLADKASEENKAYWEAVKIKVAEQEKEQAQQIAEIRANLDKGLDPFGNEIPEGWEISVDESALTPSSNPIQFFETRIEDVASYKRTEQGYTGTLTHTKDGGLQGLYQNQKFDNWADAEQGFAETVEADVNARREAALDVLEPFDTDGELRDMFDNGATGEELLEKLKEDKDWASALEDYETRGYVDLPQPAQKSAWAAFEKKLNAIRNVPAEFKPFGKQDSADEIKATLPDSKKASDLEVGDKILVKGEPKTIEKISSTDSGDMVEWSEGKKKKFKIFEDPNEDVALAPEAEEIAPEPEVAPEPEAPAPVEAPKAATPTGDIDWTTPEGAYKLYMPEDYEPEGPTGQDSPDYTDDPKVLANRFGSEDLKAALAQALRGIKDFATEFMDDFYDDLEDEEEGEKKSKPGPKKKKPQAKVKNASGYGSLEFSEGDEYVPAEAIYTALKEQGEDAELITAELYDLGTGESKNQDMVESLRKGEDVKAQEPSVLIDDFDKDSMDIVALNEEVAQPDAAVLATSQMQQLANDGEDNVFIRDIAKDLISGKNDNLGEFLGKYIGWALNGSDDEEQAYRALHGMLLSADGGLTQKGDETMLWEAIGTAIQSYNGSEPTPEEIDAVFEKFGYYSDLVRSKKKITDGSESIDDKNSLAGSFYRLVVASSQPNTTTMYRGVPLAIGSDQLASYTEKDGVISLDARSFSNDKAMAGKFAGAFGGNPDHAAVIFNVKAGKASVSPISNISMFGEENEFLGWGDFKIVDVRESVNAAGKTLYNVDIEKLDKRGMVLEGLDDDYQDLLLTNEEVDLPGSYYTPSPEPYVVDDEKNAEVHPEYTDSPAYIARMWATDDLVNVFIGGVEDGEGKALLEYPIEDGFEATVDIEAVRDALQIQGVDTNQILKDVASTADDIEASEPIDEPAESVVEDPINDIINGFGQEYDLEGFEQVGPQQGSNQGGTYKDAQGTEYYVKTPKSDNHADNEVLASALYKLAGVNAAEMKVGSADDGKRKIFSEILPGNVLNDVELTPETKKQIQEGFAIDAWLANWDVAGLVNDNIIIDEDGNAFRIDTGGSLLYRAMGAPKGSAFGGEVTELETLRDPKKNAASAALFGDMTDEDIKNSASKLLDISHDDIDNLVDSLVADEESATQLKDTLKARRNFILEKYDLLGEDTSLIVENVKVEDEETQTPEPEQPTPPAPEVPSDAPGNPYVTSDGVPIEPGMKVRHKKTGEVGTVVKYDKGNSNYVYVQGDDGTIKNKSTKQLESVNGGGGGSPEEPTPEAPSAPETTPEVQPEVIPEPEPEAAPEASNAPEGPVVIDTSKSVEDAVSQIEQAIADGKEISFYYNGKLRNVKPQSVWQNPKNGKINVYAVDLGDENKVKNFTVQNMQAIPEGEESVSAQKPEAPAAEKPLQLHAQWIKDLMAQKGNEITDEQAIKIRDLIEENGLIEKWSSADDADVIDAITEVLGPDLTDDELAPAPESSVDPATTEEQITDVPDAEPEAPETIEEPAIAPGAKVTDKKGKTGTIVKGPNKDDYVYVEFDDGTKGWRSVGSVSTTGEFNNTYKKPTTKKAPKGKITPAGVSAVFVENPAEWDSSDFPDVPSLSDAIALVQNPDITSAGMKGASAAIDSDSIEDLDVRIMRVQDAEGNDGIRLKFKLTSWAGNEKAKELLNIPQDQYEANGIKKDSLSIDRIDIGPDGTGKISKDKNAYHGEGLTWTITTKDGIVIKFNRANYDATAKLSTSKYGRPTAFHNLVQIQAPADATNEQITEALKVAGVSDVRPATQADARILVENRLMSIFDGKVDATKNPKGADREASLQRIKDKYGITADDVVVSTGASGRIETRLSEEGAKKIVEATGSPTAIQHNISVPGFYGKSDEFESRTDWITNLLATPQEGLLSTTTRWTEGIGTSGMSSAADVGTGGADYVFTKPVKVADGKTYGVSGMVMYFDPVKLYQRLDFYANSYDSFGKRVSNQDVINAAKVGAYELMFKHRVSFDDLDSIIVNNQATRTAVIQKLRQKGITEIGGRPLEAMILIGSNVSV